MSRRRSTSRFVVDFTDDPGTSRIDWLFSLVLGHSLFMQAFAALGGVPIEILMIE